MFKNNAVSNNEGDTDEPDTNVSDNEYRYGGYMYAGGGGINIKPSHEDCFLTSKKHMVCQFNNMLKHFKTKIIINATFNKKS